MKDFSARFSERKITPIFIGMLETNELDKQYELDKPWIELWNNLLQFGLVLFEPTGKCEHKDAENSIGLEELIGLRSYFERIESYRRAGRVHQLILEHKQRWPISLSSQETLTQPLGNCRINKSSGIS